MVIRRYGFDTSDEDYIEDKKLPVLGTELNLNYRGMQHIITSWCALHAKEEICIFKFFQCEQFITKCMFQELNLIITRMIASAAGKQLEAAQ
ncbi:uncharacterized protein G2W53_017643 [Senna tora]|uniref:Uncharacterized protein n=1 Tax=Senna tora TaxID=362788 RepID=A0A834TRM3_9FABA|nr:uncharacterized protein G2W53_017643 [Senna tora]